MKKNFIFLVLILVTVLALTACQGAVNTESDENEESSVIEETKSKEPTEIEQPTDVDEIKGLKLETISDFADLWNDLYSKNEKVINQYEGTPIFELVMPGTSFITGVQYDLLNLENKNGVYEGNLMFSGYKGALRKEGAKLIFGYDDVLEADGFGPLSKAGDQKVESGNCDMEKGYYFTDSYTERDGAMIQRSTSEFRQEADGSMSCLIINGHTINAMGDPSLYNQYIFIRNGKDQYDFVVGVDDIGPDFELISLSDISTKEQAIDIFQTIGCTIENSGGIVNQKLILD